MTGEQLTALAREYAESTGLFEEDKKNISAICECFLKHTLRRYTLVEKETVRKEYQEATAHVEEAIKSNNPLSEACGKGKWLVLKSLFPEIGKEVE